MVVLVVEVVPDELVEVLPVVVLIVVEVVPTTLRKWVREVVLVVLGSSLMISRKWFRWSSSGRHHARRQSLQMSSSSVVTASASALQSTQLGRGSTLPLTCHIPHWSIMYP